MSNPMTINNFTIPSWAGKPPPGLHLDVMKEEKMVQKLMIDEKKCYFFGRNKQLCDFAVEHASCSRVHAVLVWHKHLNRPFMLDLGSTHGTFIGSIRLESKNPQQVPIDSELHFGASSRRYVIREKPHTNVMSMQLDEKEESEGGLLGLPETETELNNLTEYNTARNRRITSVSELTDNQKNPRKHKRSFSVNFNEDEIIINPEDIDPSIGRFRNMVQTTIIPNKKQRMEQTAMTGQEAPRRAHPFPSVGTHTGRLSIDSHSHTDLPTTPTELSHASIVSKLGLRVPNLAPDVEIIPPIEVHGEIMHQPHLPHQSMELYEEEMARTQTVANAFEPKKKKYAKEAWPGKKPTVGSLLV